MKNNYIRLITNSPLTFKLIKKILLLSVTMIVLSVSVQLRLQYKSNIKEINQYLESITETHVPAITESVYNINERLIYYQLKGMQSLDFISYVEIRENRGGKIFVSSAGEISREEIKKEYPLIYTSSTDKVTSLGSLLVSVSYKEIYKRLYHKAILTLLVNILIILLLSIFLFILVEKTITRHIYNIAYYTEGISLSNLNKKLILKRKILPETKEDEFSLLVQSINEMRMRLAEEVSIRKKNQQEKENLREQFNQSQKLESIGRLAGGVAHDLNNLLTPIVIYSEMIGNQFDKGSEYKGFSEGIQEAGLKAKNLIAQLLTFSKNSPRDYRSEDLNRIIEGFEKLLRRTILENIQLKTSLSPDSMMIIADKNQLEQVIMNLAINAQDAMPTGGVLSLETKAVLLDETFTKIHTDIEPGHYIRLAVSDTGCGISEEQQKHIFEPFYTTKGDAGTGLGLSTVYGIVKQHKGSIWLYSEKNKGTTFKIYFPVTEIVSVKEEEKQYPPQENGFETILLVEDNQQVRDLTLMILEDNEYTVFSAKDSMEALEILKERKETIDLILTDVILPDLNGKELYERASQMRREIKVIYMSGYTDDIITFQQEGIINFIHKPFTRKKLIRKLKEVLSQPLEI